MKKTVLCALLALALALPAVSLGENTQPTVNVDDYFTKRDLSGEWDAKKAVEMTLTESVTITEAGVYILSGAIADGTVTVRAGKDDKVQLVLNGVSVTSSSSAAILVENADKVFITLAEGTENKLTSTGFDENSSIDGAVYAKDDVVFNGKGALTVDSAKHGIVCKNDVKITGGVYSVTAQKRGIYAHDSVRVAGGSLTVVSEKEAIMAKNEEDTEKGYVLIAGGTVDLTAGGGAENGKTHSDDMFMGRGAWNNQASSSSQEDDSGKGLKATGSVILAGGTITVDAADDAIHAGVNVTVYDGTVLTISTGDDAIHSDGALTIEGGEIRILTSYEGLEAAAITVNGGDISLVSSDDGLNSAGGSDGSGWGRFDMFASDGSSITVNGGVLYVNAAGDGIDSNGDLTVNGGTVVVSGPTDSMNGALDANGTMAVNGGTVIAAGAVGMAESFGSSSAQVSFLTNLSGGENSEITVTDASGKVLLSAKVEKSFSCVVVSSPDLQVGETYTLSSGSASVTVTVSGVSSGGNGGFGGGPDGFGGGFGGGPGGRQSWGQPDQNTPSTDATPPAALDFPDGQNPPEGDWRPEEGTQS